jgi:hypothetical protein
MSPSRNGLKVQEGELGTTERKGGMINAKLTLKNVRKPELQSVVVEEKGSREEKGSG